MGNIEAVQRLRLWFETNDGMLLCQGRIRVLELVDALGSLRKAALAMEMSYRAAWGRIKQTEAVLGAPLIVRIGARKHFSLTPLGRELVVAYKLWREDVESFALDRAQALFSWSTSRTSRESSGKKHKKP